MPFLCLKSPDGKLRTLPLLKRITTVGRGPDNDIRLEDPRAPDNALHLQLDGERCAAVSMGGAFLFEGKKREQATLADGGALRVGDTELTFRLRAPEEKDTAPDEGTRELLALRSIHAFSEKLFGVYDLARILEGLMDEAIALTRADKGFLILFENGEMHVKVARNLSRENLEDALERVSDSIVAKVVRTQRPLILEDALDDPEFKGSQSVVNLKLLSVMCVPLMHKGDLFGLVYVGNDRLTHRFDARALELLTIFAAQASLLVQNALLVNDLFLSNTELKRKLEDKQLGDIIGSSAGMREVLKKLEKVAPTDISVLIAGETGTGKELIARELHRRSPRAKGPFVTINCGAIPENLLESELFGHVKGAFTGAVVTRAGRFQAAIGGTLFLDEVGEMPLSLQVKLLRALQEKVVYKVGDTRPEPVDIRVVAATNRILEEMVRENTFREDLYYRLNVVTLQLPPLRDRGEDVLVLGKFFLGKYTAEFGAKARGFTPAAVSAMKKYGWPGNIRELENKLKKAVVLADGPLLGPDDLDLSPDRFAPILPLAQAKEEFQKRYINEILERNNGNRTKSAKDLGVDPRTIFRHLEKLEAERQGRVLPPDPDGEPEELS